MKSNFCVIHRRIHTTAGNQNVFALTELILRDVNQQTDLPDRMHTKGEELALETHLAASLSSPLFNWREPLAWHLSVLLNLEVKISCY